ncbi:ribonuclease E activity regulator RraA [Variovorax sp. PCZ-1]|uniref:ribonuclease E activity regulator RraA n=1 Tax=Variovorax sp. PCZ-1 TaxID=2835533 RepID=UPI001BCC12A1|nr:ribonuclease E activity regulator RraA [Variovorax sp. PCZ-1]MBS7807068.1 ribonuclease E activity regulator RraA [Variovorax sp. PCZ-1]
MTLSVCDLCDTHEAEFAGSNSKQLRILPDVYKSYGGKMSFHGQAHTLRCFEDNSRVREAVAQPGQLNGVGRVLVIDGGGMTRRALVGGNLAVTAAKNGWAGILVHGAVRDIAELRVASLGIKALALCPLRTDKRGLGDAGVPVMISGHLVQPGDWVYADEDGVLISSVALH